MRRSRLLAAMILSVVGAALAIGGYAWLALGTFQVPLPDALQGEAPGSLVSVERTGRYPRIAVQQVINAAALPDPWEIDNGITKYLLRYRTTNYDGESVIASGLLALPTQGIPDAVISYQHGTSTSRAHAPSQPGLGEGLFLAAAVAGRGNVLVAPDYIGLGESRDLHPYLHTATAVSTCRDLLKAARAFVEQERGAWPGKLFLVGFSQGGHATLALHQALERNPETGFEVTASAPCAGAFFMNEISFPQALTGATFSHSVYLGYAANSYARIYGEPLDTLLRAPYAETVPQLFDGGHTGEDLAAGLPAAPRDLFTSEFLAAYESGAPHWFTRAFTDNSLPPARLRAPVRFYYGDADVDVLPEEALRMAAAMQGLGSDAKAVSVGAYEHDPSALRAIPAALKWFEEF
ncbi:MAG: hypothetical protein GC168_20795 [Candidatus Hydrogenedens sp.]|nr:hypothetical protein [Candidatus Hydrogenedens sp.]